MINFMIHMSGATENMKRAAFEVRKIINPSCKNDDINDCGVSIDGSFALLNSVVVTISQDNSNVIDAVVLSKFCKGYQI